MKVLVLGGSGRVGKGAASDLVNSDKVSEVTLGDINKEEAIRYIERLGSKKLKYDYIDLNDFDNLVSKMKEYDVIANAAWFQSVVDVTRAAIEAKRNCCDAGGFYYHNLKQLEYHEAVKKAGITVLMGMAAALELPTYAYDTEQTSSMRSTKFTSEQAAAYRNPNKGDGQSMTIRTGFEELTDKPMVYRDGKMILVEPRSGEEKVVFAEPLGERTVYFARHSEMVSLPGFRMPRMSISKYILLQRAYSKCAFWKTAV